MEESEHLSLIESGDGSHTLYNSLLDETYHSRHGAWQESSYVFIKQGLLYTLENYPKEDSLRILEVGMGTGLNVLLTAIEATKLPNQAIHYCALEPYPIPDDLLAKLNYSERLTHEQKELFSLIHTSEWDKEIALLPNFVLEKRKEKAQNFLKAEFFDLVYFDAFAPNKQSEMWDKDLFFQLSLSLRKPSVLVSYCAQGHFRRSLASAGFSVEKLPGPPMKREMVRAVIS
jgi:tRNA U34 5-methylaminomethyl-2-thiouridine-forming methyltransferase MnmC